MNNEGYAFNPAGESFQTFLSIVNDMNEAYLKLSSAIEAENNDWFLKGGKEWRYFL